jgi:hypothetical protein
MHIDLGVFVKPRCAILVQCSRTPHEEPAMNRNFRGTAPLVPLVTLALLAFAACAFTGCRSPEDKLPPVVIHTPLDVDPMDRHEFTGWWTNGEQLVRLNPDASYVLWPTQNRYQPPHERGRWSQQSYAVLRLEPFTRYHTDPHRVRILKVGDEIGIQLPGMEPMTMIERPALMPEDELFGTWQGDAGTLRLRDTMRYSFSPRAIRTDQPLVLAGHEGRWRLVENAIELHPDTGREVITLPLRINNGQRSADYPGGDFHMQP